MSEKLEVLITAKDEASKVFDGLGNTMKGAFKVGLGVAAGGLGLLTGGLALSIKEAMEAEQVQAELNAVLKSTGGIAGVTAKMANNLATAWSKETRFSDESILSAENMLLTFTNIKDDVFPGATEAVLNMGEKFGSLDQASVLVGKALNDPIGGLTALKRVGVQFTDEQEKMIKHFMDIGDVASAQKIILGELETEFGGLAEAAGDTLGGKLAILKNQLLNVAESVGMALIPALSDGVTFILDNVVPAIAGFADALVAAFQSGGLAGVGALIWEQIKAGFPVVATWVQTNIIDKIVTAITTADWSGILDSGLDLLSEILANIANATKAIKPETLGFLALALGVMTVPTIIAGVAAIATAIWSMAAGAIAAVLPLALLAGVALAIQTNFGGVRDSIDQTAEGIKNNDLKTTLDGILDTLTAIPKGLAEALGEKLGIDVQGGLDAWVGVADQVGIIVGALPGAILGFLGLTGVFAAVSGFVTETLLPGLGQVAGWLWSTLGIAVDIAVAAWNDVLKPAFQAIYDFVEVYVWPKLKDLSGWLDTAFGTAIGIAVGAWNDTLKPSFQEIYDFIHDTVLPSLQGVSLWLSSTFKWAVDTMGGVWTGTLKPAFQAIHDFLKDTLQPVLDVFQTAWDAIKTAIEGIPAAIQSIIDIAQDFIDTLGDITDAIPDWMIPGSPTPFELGLRGIADAWGSLADLPAPVFAPSLGGGGQFASTQQQNYNLTIHSNAPTENVIADFNLMRSWAGA